MSECVAGKNQRSSLKRSHQRKRKKMLKETNRRKRESCIGSSVFDRWLTCRLAGRDARLVWGSVVFGADVI